MEEITGASLIAESLKIQVRPGVYMKLYFFRTVSKFILWVARAAKLSSFRLLIGDHLEFLVPAESGVHVWDSRCSCH